MTKNERKNESTPRKAKGLTTGFRFSLEERYVRLLLLFTLAVLLTVVIIPKGGFVPDYYAPGDIASRDIKAPRDMLIPDLELTEKKRQEAHDATLALYDFDPKAGQEIFDRLLQALKAIQGAKGKEGEFESLLKEVEGLVGVSLTADEVRALGRLSPLEIYQVPLRNILIQTLNRQVVGNLQLFEADREKGIVIRDLETQKEAPGKNLDQVIGLGEAQDFTRSKLETLEGVSDEDRALVFAVIQKLLRPNLTFNKSETEAIKRKAAEEVKPVLFQMKKGEMIVREGEKVTSDQIKKLRALRELGGDLNVFRMGLGMLAGIALLIVAAHSFAQVNIRKYRPRTRDFLFLTAAFLGLFLLIKIAIFISTALETAFPYIESPTYYYVFPFAVGAILVRIVLNSEIALIFTLVFSVLMGLLFGNSLFITLYTLVGSLTGAHWVRQCKQRTTLYRAGMWVSIANVLMILALHFMAGRAMDIQLLYKLGFGLAGGFFCAVIVTGTVPLVEHLFKYTTDIKLLELANMNTPVLRELMIQAPGTYHHSIIVGNLVEAAAEAINANPLLARVAAYYHDIGKIRKPLYFVENIGNLENKHDKLAPSMSALILMAHVKDGVELAREIKLGDPLVDIIRQHHGTALIKFFYDKAKSKEDPGVQQVDEREYRYPGPKPQTREAALIMLADAVEAASRTLTDPTPARIQGMVQKIINNIFIDGQLDECELTLKDLHNIAKSFNRILSGIFHHRIDYPEPAFKERDKDPSKRKNVEDSDREPPKEAKDKEVGPAKGGSEDLKRLGMS